MMGAHSPDVVNVKVCYEDATQLATVPEAGRYSNREYSGCHIRQAWELALLHRPSWANEIACLDFSHGFTQATGHIAFTDTSKQTHALHLAAHALVRFRKHHLHLAGLQLIDDIFQSLQAGGVNKGHVRQTNDKYPQIVFGPRECLLKRFDRREEKRE